MLKVLQIKEIYTLLAYSCVNTFIISIHHKILMFVANNLVIKYIFKLCTIQASPSDFENQEIWELLLGIIYSKNVIQML